MIKKAIKFIKAKGVGPLFLVIDLFCGFGGTTTGYDNAMYVGSDGRLYNVAKVIACVNHDPKAIKSHWLNHPDVKHFEEDIRSLDLTELIELVNYWRAIYPDAYVVLWASLECTNYSKAKGGQVRDADSRTLALHLFRYQVALNPDYIKIENVVEFMSWGPMKAKVYKTDDEFEYEYCEFNIQKVEVPVLGEDGLYMLQSDGKVVVEEVYKAVFGGVPESRDSGKDWMRWKQTMNKLGYLDDWKQLNSADFGAYTSRNRLFGCFAKTELKIVWPEPTHFDPKKKNNNRGVSSLFGNIDLKPWLPVKDVLNFTDEGKSIFNRKKDLSNKTLEVIYKGIIKALEEGENSILFKYYGKGINLNSINKPAGVITTKDRFAKLAFVFRQYKTGFTSSISAPIGAIPTNPKANIVSFVMNKSHGGIQRLLISHAQ